MLRLNGREMHGKKRADMIGNGAIRYLIGGGVTGRSDEHIGAGERCGGVVLLPSV